MSNSPYPVYGLPLGSDRRELPWEGKGAFPSGITEDDIPTNVVEELDKVYGDEDAEGRSELLGPYKQE